MMQDKSALSGRWKGLEESHKSKKWQIILALLLLLLVSATALEVTLVSRNRQNHPTVTVPLETASEQPEPSTEVTVEPTAETATETTAQTTEETIEATAPTSAQAEATLL